MSRWLSRDVAETEALGRRLAGDLAPDGALLLTGDLGAGKTVLVRGIAAGLGLDPAEIQSPTFTLVREHDGREARLVHADLYRLEPGEVDAIGLEETLAGPGVKVVEWAERLPFPVPGARHIEIRRTGSADGRELLEHTFEDFKRRSEI